MEIQSFFLAENITPNPKGGYDVKRAAVHNFYPLDDKYPLTFQVPYYMLVHRNVSAAEEEITLKFNLINSDGQAVGTPSNLKVAGSFPANHKFMNIVGMIELLFPDAGEYRLDITADEEKLPSIFSYSILVSNRES